MKNLNIIYDRINFTVIGLNHTLSRIESDTDRLMYFTSESTNYIIGSVESLIWVYNTVQGIKVLNLIKNYDKCEFVLDIQYCDITSEAI